MVRLALIGVAGFVAAVALTGSAAGDLLPTLPTLPTLPVTPPTAPPPPPLPPAPPVPPAPTLPVVPPPPPVATPAVVPPPPAPPSSGQARPRHHGRAAAAPTSARRSAVVPVRLRARGTLVFVVRSGCEFVGRRTVPARRGVNNVRLAPRVHGRPLAPGIYRVSVDVVRGGQQRHLQTIGLEVARERGRLTSTRRPAPAAPVCTVATLPPAVLAAGSPLASAPVSSASAQSPPHSGVLGASFPPLRLGPAPALPSDGDGGGLAGFVLTMYAIAALAAAPVLVYGARELWRSRNT